MIVITDESGAIPQLNLDKSQGWHVSSFDPGFPSVDEDMQPRVQASGMLDYTRYYNEAVITLEALLYPGPQSAVSRQQMVDRLAQFCHPGRRVRVHWQFRDDTVMRSMECRGRNLIRPNNAWNRRSVQAQWVAPRGIQESSQQILVRLVPGSIAAIAGRTYPLVYDRVYPVAGPSGASSAENQGNEVAWPVIRINGPATNPKLTNATTGELFEFTITIPTGSFLEIRTADDLVLMNGAINDSRYSSMNLATSLWWGLQPGINSLVFEATGTSIETTADFYYRHAYI